MNLIEIKLLNNSGFVPQIDSTIYQQREAVAFALIISDSSYYQPYYSGVLKKNNFSFIKNAQAFTCEEEFVLTNSITNLSITTAYKFSNSVHENEDVTDKFVGEIKSLNHGMLYYTVPQIVDFVNRTEIFRTNLIEIYLFLAQPLEADSARFSIDISFEDGLSLSAISPTIRIIDTE